MMSRDVRRQISTRHHKREHDVPEWTLNNRLLYRLGPSRDVKRCKMSLYKPSLYIWPFATIKIVPTEHFGG